MVRTAGVAIHMVAVRAEEGAGTFNEAEGRGGGSHSFGASHFGGGGSPRRSMNFSRRCLSKWDVWFVAEGGRMVRVA